jgi:hypothetical protein
MMTCNGWLCPLAWGCPMSNRRADAIYFVLLLGVCVIGYYASNWPADEFGEGATLVLPDFNPPQLEFEIPFDFPYAIPDFESRVAPTMQLSNDMESALGEVRSALLESSRIIEVGSNGQLVAANE